MTNNKTKQELSARDRIRIWMIAVGRRQSDLARDLDVTPSAITHFLAGRGNSKRIRAHFLARGCPAELLDALGKAEGKAA